MKTAVEYLEQQIKEWGLVVDTVTLQGAIQTAKNFEVTQMKECWNASYKEMHNSFSNDYYKQKTFEEYFLQTFKN